MIDEFYERLKVKFASNSLQYNPDILFAIAHYFKKAGPNISEVDYNQFCEIIAEYGEAEYERSKSGFEYALDAAKVRINALEQVRAKLTKIVIELQEELHSMPSGLFYVCAECTERVKEENIAYLGDRNVCKVCDAIKATEIMYCGEIEKLKEQNKELMRANVGFRANILQLAETITEILSKEDIKKHNEFIKNRDDDFEGKIKETLQNISLMNATELEQKGFDACKWMIKSLWGIHGEEEMEAARNFFEPKTEETDLEKQCGVKIDIDMSPVRRQEPDVRLWQPAIKQSDEPYKYIEWYDAEKCLPLPYLPIKINYERYEDDGSVSSFKEIRADLIAGVGSILWRLAEGNECIDISRKASTKILRWRYIDE